MNPKQLVRLSNIIGVISILLLLYWITTFITIEVFGLKVFKKNMTETFYMSILGILALMIGALMINIMFNLTRIAQRHNQDEPITETRRYGGWVLIGRIPLLIALLFGGDFLTTRKKEQMLVASASSIISAGSLTTNHLGNYRFDWEWIEQTADRLQILSRKDDALPYISVIIQDTLLGEPVFLDFRNYSMRTLPDTLPPNKRDYIRETSGVEREYLNRIFEGKENQYRYSAHDGSYELFYPFDSGAKRMVIYFSEHRRYGKIGS